MRRIDVVIAGLGPRGFHTYGKYQNLYPERMRVVAVADPDPAKREEAALEFHLDGESCFKSAEEMFSRPRLAEVAFICTQDAQHLAHSVLAMEKGYDLLLEKPIATSLEDCLTIRDTALSLGRTVVVCHVLRYTSFYRTVKEIVGRGDIGEIVNVEAAENVGYWHQAHSFVRGNWRRAEESCPMILAKCCHDLDILNFLIGKRCIKLNSYGSTHLFRHGKKPAGATDRCFECPYARTCVYSAVKIYLSEDSLEKHEWLCRVAARVPTPENLRKALEDGPYGRCVYACDNDVVDHQTVNMLYEDGITATLTMSAFSEKNYRTIRIMGTLGEIEGDQDTNLIRLIRFGEEPVFFDINKLASDLSGHGGGDNGMLTDFFTKLNGDRGEISSSIVNSIESHVMAFAAESSRLSGGENIDLGEYPKI